MRLNVQRLGHVFEASHGPAWMQSHATYTAPVLRENGLIRIFFVTRDTQNRGQLAWLDVDPQEPTRVVEICQTPGLIHGPLGSYDDAGIANGNIVSWQGGLRLYYMGWNPATNVPFRNSIGCADSTDDQGLKFERPFAGPLLDRSRHDPFTLSYPFVRRAPSDDHWQMYYGTSRAGGDVEDEMDHVLTLATSHDGTDWRPTGRVVVALSPGEYGLSRPWITRQAGRDLLLFSIRRQSYTIGAAELSADGCEATRISDDVMGQGQQAWENDATCYPATVNANGQTLLFYSGNGYGRTGFGVATLDAI